MGPVKKILSGVMLLAVFLIAGCSSPALNNTPTVGSVAAPASPGFSKADPAPLNTTVAFDEAANDSGQGYAVYTARLTLREVLRGNAAMDKMRHDIPYYMVSIPDDREFLLARFRYELADSNPPGASRLVSRNPFELYRDNGFNPDDNKNTVGPLPDLYGKITKGGAVEGWIVFTVPKGSPGPLIAYNRYAAGSSGIWFKTA